MNVPQVPDVEFPRAARYNPRWVAAAVSGGANPVLLADWLTQAMELRPGMRVLDLGCGRGASSVFLAMEFDVHVWSVDLWFASDERLQRIRDAGVADLVHPVRADARRLPFAAGSFDAIISVDAYSYFGTDDLYLGHPARLLRPGGLLGIAGAPTVREVDAVPEHLRSWWDPTLACLHSPSWWRRHWQRSGFVDVVDATLLPDGWRHWVEWLRMVNPDNSIEIDAVSADRGETLGYARVVGRRNGVRSPSPITDIPVSYERHPVFVASSPIS